MRCKFQSRLSFDEGQSWGEIKPLGHSAFQCKLTPVLVRRIMETYEGGCHCGLIKFSIKTELSYSVRCDCSICRRRGSIMVRCDAEDLKMLQGEEHLQLYQFGSNVAKHYFCKHCGVYTFHRMRKLPNKFGINAGCLEGVDLSVLTPILIEGSTR